MVYVVPAGTEIPAMDLSVGCMLIGVLFNVFLFGMSIVQGFLYFTQFKSDKLFMKIFVGVLLVADTLNAVLDTGFIYQYLVSHFGNLDYATKANAMFTADPALTSIIAFACQSFFAWRVYRLMHSWWCPILILCISFASFLCAIGTTVGVSIVLNFTQFQKLNSVVSIWLACAAAADLIITVALCFTLNKSRTGFTATDDVITKLIRMAVQTGMATTTFAIIDLICFLATPTTLHLVFNLPLAKLYVNSLLSTLNARALLTNNHAGNNRGTMDVSSSGGFKDNISKGTSMSPLSAFRKVSGGSSNGGGRQARFNPTASTGADSLSSPTRGTFLFGKSHSGGNDGVTVNNLNNPSSNKHNLLRPGGGNNNGASNNFDLESGIQVTTVEERFEEPYDSTNYNSSSNVALMPMVSSPYSNNNHQRSVGPMGVNAATTTPTRNQARYYPATLPRDESDSSIKRNSP